MSDRIFLRFDDLVLGTDDLQWILYRKRGADWRAISFVRSTPGDLAPLHHLGGLQTCPRGAYLALDLLLMPGGPQTVPERELSSAE